MFAKLKLLYWRFIKSPIEQARHLGVKIGEDCFISCRDWGTEPYLITIGNHVQVTQGVHFHTHGGAHVARRYDPTFDCFGKVVVKDYAYIGSSSHIMPGVTIGEGSLIAAGSIVCKSVPDNELWGGCPAKRICTVEEFIKRNEKYNLGTYGLSMQEKKQVLLSTPDEKFIHK